MLEDRWQGEDEEDAVKENWDDEDEVEEEPEQIVVPKKKTMKEKIAEREENERLKREERQKERELRNKKLTPEEILAEKLERQKLSEESDLRLAMDTFGVGSASKSANINLDEFTLQSKEDFERFRTDLVSKLSDVSSEPFYSAFLEDLFRDLCVPLDTDDLKRISSSLTALYNEKLKAQRNTNKTKKKGKGTSIKMEKNVARNAFNDDDDYLDDGMDDFM